jgi:hypothetical protein
MSDAQRPAPKDVPTVYPLGRMPDTHRAVEEVQCPLCTGWRRADRKCFRCDGGI